MSKEVQGCEEVAGPQEEVFVKLRVHFDNDDRLIFHIDIVEWKL
jgi:hypothetical protein